MVLLPELQDAFFLFRKVYVLCAIAHLHLVVLLQKQADNIVAFAITVKVLVVFLRYLVVSLLFVVIGVYFVTGLDP
jgi:hypothetical protein